MLNFADMLTLIEDRGAVLRAAASDAGTGRPVPGCPEWSVRDLLAHLGAVQRFWAAVVAAGPAATPPQGDQLPGRQPGEDLLAWSAESTGVLLAALRQYGPDRPAWTWWPESGAPMTSGAIARHQVQEAAVHTFDAQQAAGRADPLPGQVAADGIGEYLTVGMASMGAWPHQPGQIGLAAAEGITWLIDLDDSGARARARPAGQAPGAPEAAAGPGAWIRGTSSDLVLALYGRQPHHSVSIEGDEELAALLLSWTFND